MRPRATGLATSLAAGLVAAGPAWAHAGSHAQGFGWTFDPIVTTVLAGAAALVGLGTLRVSLRTRRLPRGRALRLLAFGGGWLSFVLALLSPLHAWGEHLFTAHMVEHEVLMAVAAPLLVLAKPLGTALWALPRPVRDATARALRSRGTRAGWSVAVHPAGATVLHAVVLWGWHAPPVFEASLASGAVHLLQHASFLAGGMVFWWSMIHRAAPGEALGHVTITMIHMSVLGALIALAPRVIYLRQTSGAALAGLTPLADQQIAGLVMWIPAGTLYAAAALGFAAVWIRGSGQTWRPVHDEPRTLIPLAVLAAVTGFTAGTLLLHRQTVEEPRRKSGAEDAPAGAAIEHHRPMLAVASCLVLALLAGGGLLGWKAFQKRQQSVAVATALTHGDPDRAPALMLRFGCAGCHTIPGVPGADGQVAQSLEGLRERVFVGGVLRNTGDNLVRWIVNPQAVSPRSAMPATGIDEAQARDVAAWLYAH